MDLFQAFIFGIVQGLTEFMPISSSAHLVLLPWLFRWNDPGLTFDVALHLGTLVAVLAFFWRDWVQMLRSVISSARRRDLGDRHTRLAWFIVLASIPGAAAGAILESHAETTFRDARLIAIMLIALGLVLLLAEFVGSRRKELERVSFRDSIFIGIAQAFAIVPGVSRSGSTISMGLLCGLTRDTAARFSFLLGTPIIAGAAGKAFYDIYEVGLPSDQMQGFAVGMITSAVAGYICIGFLLRFLRRNSTAVFVAYRLALGLGVLALTFVGW